MITVKQARKIDPTLNDHTDEELQAVLDLLYGQGNLAFEKWQKDKLEVSKIPDGLLPGQN